MRRKIWNVSTNPKPSQGLKLRHAEYSACLRMGLNQPQTLSGIETCQFTPPPPQLTVSTKPKPSQGLKHGYLLGLLELLKVSTKPKPSQGLKPRGYSSRLPSTFVSTNPKPSQGLKPALVVLYGCNHLSTNAITSQPTPNPLRD